MPFFTFIRKFTFRLLVAGVVLAVPDLVYAQVTRSRDESQPRADATTDTMSLETRGERGRGDPHTNAGTTINVTPETVDALLDRATNLLQTSGCSNTGGSALSNLMSSALE